MDYQKLLQRLAELDQPTTKSAVSECGDMAPLPSIAQSTTPPTMSVNLNAQGMDNIESLLKLMTKVNPDMAKPVAPMSMVADPHPATLLSLPVDMDGEEDGELDRDKHEIAPLAAVGAGLGRAAAGAMGAGGIGQAAGAVAGRVAGSAAADALSDEPEEGYANEPDEETKDVDYIINKVSGGMNKPQGTYPKVAGGDNPMQKVKSMEGAELRASIRAELLQRLAEAKGAK